MAGSSRPGGLTIQVPNDFPEVSPMMSPTNGGPILPAQPGASPNALMAACRHVGYSLEGTVSSAPPSCRHSEQQALHGYARACSLLGQPGPQPSVGMLSPSAASACAPVRPRVNFGEPASSRVSSAAVSPAMSAAWPVQSGGSAMASPASSSAAHWQHRQSGGGSGYYSQYAGPAQYSQYAQHSPYSPPYSPVQYPVRPSSPSRWSNFSGTSSVAPQDPLEAEVRFFEWQRDKMILQGYTLEEFSGHARWLAETQLPNLGPMLLRNSLPYTGASSSGWAGMPISNSTCRSSAVAYHGAGPCMASGSPVLTAVVPQPRFVPPRR